MDSVKQALAQIKAQWSKLPPKARSLIMAVAVLGTVAAIGFAVASRQPKRVLFSGLDPRDSASVVAALDGAKIEYELGGGGTSIHVNAGDIDRARILLAEQDLPKSGNVGFELFAEQSFGVTDFAQQVNYRRALQGELERTIGEIDAVGRARVHITLPKKAVFEDEKLAPTASVTLDLLRGRNLGDRNVRAVRHLVASAVEGLEAAQVTVVDTKGNLLSRAGAGEDEAVAALDYESDFERSLEQKMTRLLERTVGVGGAEVRVAADFDFSKTDTTEEVYDPEQTAVRSESTQEIVENGNAGSRPGGVAGAQANSPGTVAAGSVGSGGSSQTVRNKNYEVNRTVVHTKGAGAQLKRLSVAVLVDGTYEPTEDGSDPVFSPRSEDELAELQAVVGSAVGLDASRGDTIKIASVPFRDRPTLGDLGAGAGSGLPQWLPYAVGGGALAVVAMGWFVFARRRGAQNRVLEPEVLTLPATVEQAQARLQRVEAGNPLAVAAGEDPKALPAAGLEEIPTREDILAIAANDPERTADIIRIWMQADEPA